MGTFSILNQSASGKNLQRLFLLRIIAIASQIIIFWTVYSVIELELPWMPIILTISLLAVLNFFTWIRLRYAWLVTNPEFFVQLLIDVASLTALLYFSGGSTNPFISLYLLPLTIAATVLPWHYTWTMAVITISCYTFLLFQFVPLPHDHLDDHSRHMFEFNLHVSGMWLTFVLSTLLITFFVVKMNASIRDRDKELSRSREQALQNEQIIALGTLAAGAAHELGTPLSTMAIITGELQQESLENVEFQRSIRILRDQIALCKQTLTHLLADAGQARVEEGNGQPVDVFLQQVIDKWQLVRPSIRFTSRYDGMQPAPVIMNTRLLSQSILNLLNNAADASIRQVDITCRWDEKQLHLEILDDGPGLDAEAAEHAGEPFFTSKGPGQGFGIGLFLANTNIERFGGSVRLFNRPEGGACTHVILPVLQGTASTSL
ncbi:MAG: HAMP domain-containing histidine kinase [Nitrosomonas sp.]|uniref:ATP-binding protein n=1 Tax=Nitrosomonas sp. TaxID=42353 RepID=UPI0025D5BC3E|nr:ATP-binding protein [Nitrosomonas sp.]MCC6160790.1 HAMP domain-containing histidine kinase [Nitrosomonas sp.]